MNGSGMKHFGFAAFSRRIILRGALTPCTGLHVGAGTGGITYGVDKVVVRDRFGRPFIPGSSVKGVVRAAAASALRAFERRDAHNALHCRQWACADDLNTEKEACLAGDGSCFVRDVLRHDGGPDPSPAEVEKAAFERTCPVCGVYGSPYRAAQARFADSYLCAPDEWLGAEIRDGVGIDRATRTAKTGIKYDFEAVPPGTVFGLEVLLENPSDWALGVVLLGFDLLHQGLSRLGGIKSRGLGKVRIEWRCMTEWDAKSVLRNQPAKCLTREPEVDPKVEQTIDIWLNQARRDLEVAVLGTETGGGHV
jgi:CRISPR-associated protein Csm3